MAAYAPQIEHILQQIGRGGASDQAMAKWLFANELPITAENMQTLEMLDQMQQSTCLEITLQQIVQTMAMGLPAEQTVPGGQRNLACRGFDTAGKRDHGAGCGTGNNRKGRSGAAGLS